MKHTPLVVGNWKMNPGTLKAAETLFRDTQKELGRVTNVEIFAAPPSLFTVPLLKFSKKLGVAAQNAFSDGLGAHTGEISLQMLKSLGVTTVIIGHSERRALGESDADVSRKLTETLKAGMRAIVCVGERDRDQHGDYLPFVEKQVREALRGIPKAKLGNIAIAYEPIWAIGTGKNASAHDAYEMKLFIQKVLADLYGRPALSKVRILYGGSVTKLNAEELYTEGQVDGFLVGGSSLRASEFGAIVKLVSHHG